MATKRELKAQNAELQETIAQLNAEKARLEQEEAKLIEINRLIRENGRLEKENETIAELEKSVDKMGWRKYRLKQDNQKLRRKIIETQTIKKGMDKLKDNVWKPLQEMLVSKFKEFDINGNGYVDKHEFHLLCKKIESEMKVIRLFSMLDQHSASTVYANDKPGNGHNTGYIDSTQGWTAKYNDKNQWYQIDAVVSILIGGILLQGRYNCDQWVTKFKISHSENGVTWTNISKIFKGCMDRDSKVRVIFDSPIHARYVRIHPEQWHGSNISLRADLLWVENYQDIKHDADEEKGEEKKSMFTVDEENKLFDLFDLKGNGVIELTEFFAVLDREAIRDETQHPNQIIKETMKHLLYGNVIINEEYNINMLGKESKGYKYQIMDMKCCICNEKDGIYGLNEKCNHQICWNCLNDSLQNIMTSGDFPAYCMACKAQDDINGNVDNSKNLDILFKPELIRFWVEEGIIDISFGVRFHKQQDRFMQELQFEDLLKTTGMRKCPNCGLVILKNDGCNWFKCKECQTEICYQTGLIAGKGPGKCGGGHSCHY